MFAIYERVTRAALNLANPYTHGEDQPLPGQIWPYLKSHLYPLRYVLVLSVLFTVVTATIEVWLISYAGRLIDILADVPPAQIWQAHRWNLMGAVVMLILIRPIAHFARHAVNGIGLQCNAANLFRWRAHDHLTQQSVGWFQEDLTGRTASRLVDMGNYAADLIYHVLNAVAFGVVYMVGIIALMAGTDPRLALPLFFWLALYIGLMVYIVPRMIKAQETFQSAKSALRGGVVDTLSNFDTMSLFAKRAEIEADHKIWLEDTRQSLFKTRQIGVGLRTTIVLLEGIIMAGFVGYGIWLWSEGAATIGLVSAAMALSLRITTMADWVLEAVWSIFLQIGSIREALRTIGQPIANPPTVDAPVLEVGVGEIKIEGVQHHYGRDHGGLNGINLTVAAGKKVGLVGRSGAGKSTLVNLILRFHEIEHGRISIDGQDIRDVELQSLRQAIGMVSQGGYW